MPRQDYCCGKCRTPWPGVCATKRDCAHHRAYDFQAQIEDETNAFREDINNHTNAYRSNA